MSAIPEHTPSARMESLAALDPILLGDLDYIVGCPLPWSELHRKHVLVTGAAGFIGGHVLETLAFINQTTPGANIHIYALVRDLKKLKVRLPWLAIPGDITPVVQDVQKAWTPLHAVDIIIHAASPASPKTYMETPVQTILANTVGTHNLLEFAREKKAQLVFLSSGVVYGQNTLGTESIGELDFGGGDPLAPRACYAESKRLAETLCRAYFTQYGVDTRIARISHCYGPSLRLDDGRVIADLLANIHADRDILLDSDGSASRPFCYISDTVSGLFHVLLKGEPGAAYNVGATDETSILELAKKMIVASGKSGRLVIKPRALNAPPPAPRNSGHFNIDKIGALGWSPHIGLDVGLARLFAFVRNMK